MTIQRRTRSRQFAALSLLVAAAISYFIPPVGLGIAKMGGMALALVAVVPVLFLIKSALTTESTNRLLSTFVGGFLFKLIFILIGVWLAVSLLKWEVIPFTVSCLSFLFALQVCEALYFWGRKSF
jgi:F0F1-type ATP synthase assembly protein I